MDKFSIYSDIEERVHQCNELTKTPEGKFLAGIVLQRVKDAMGMHRADVWGPVSSKADKATHQEIAIKWFRDGQHFVWCDMLGITPSWINHLIKTKGGVKL